VAQEDLVDRPLLLRLHCLSLLKLPENSPLDLPVQRSKVLIHIYVLFCFHATVVDVVVDVDVDVDVDVVIRYLHLPPISKFFFTAAPLDMVFVIDGPPTITDEEFTMAIKFIITIINAFPVSPLGVHIGVVVEKPSGTIVVELARYKEKSHVDAAVREIISALSDDKGATPSIGKKRSGVQGRGTTLAITLAAPVISGSDQLDVVVTS
jgi:hypothetical protein